MACTSISTGRLLMMSTSTPRSADSWISVRVQHVLERGGDQVAQAGLVSGVGDPAEQGRVGVGDRDDDLGRLEVARHHREVGEPPAH